MSTVTAVAKDAEERNDGPMLAVHAPQQSRNRNWAALAIANLTITFAAVYLLACLVRFVTKQKRARSCFCCYIPTKMTHEKLCLVSTCFVLVRSVGEHVGLFATTDAMCMAYKISYTVTYHLSMIPLYLLLWKRQRKLYRQKTIKHLISHFFRFVSANIFLFYACFSLASAYFYLHMFKVRQSPKGCVHDPSMFGGEGVSSNASGKSYIIASVAIFFSVGIPFFQVIFLLLFLFPLMRQYDIGALCFLIKSTRKTSAAILRVMKRCALCTFVCVSSDLLLFGCYSLAYNDLISVNTWSLLVNVNGTMHNIVIILSFKHWKKILCPWVGGGKDERVELVRMRNLVVSSSAGGRRRDEPASSNQVVVCEESITC